MLLITVVAVRAGLLDAARHSDDLLLDVARRSRARRVSPRPQPRIRPGGACLGLSDWQIIFKHLLPNAMVATLTFLPFKLSGGIAALTALDFLGLGMPPGSPSLGELLLEGKKHLEAPWLGISGFISVSIILSLAIFMGEAVRDALDPRKTFRQVKS